MDLDVFKALTQHNPRIKHLLNWRMSLGEITSSQQVADYFRDDWNKIEEVYKRLATESNDKEHNA